MCKPSDSKCGDIFTSYVFNWRVSINFLLICTTVTSDERPQGPTRYCAGKLPQISAPRTTQAGFAHTVLRVWSTTTDNNAILGAQHDVTVSFGRGICDLQSPLLHRRRHKTLTAHASVVLFDQVVATTISKYRLFVVCDRGD